MPENTIHLRGMEFFAYHGVMPKERKLGQRFIVDAELTLVQSGVFDKDDLALTVDYAQVYAKIAQVMTQTSQTIEYIAEQIAQEVLTDFACSAVSVEVHKPQAPIQGTLDDVSVVVVRKAMWQAYLSMGSNRGDRAAYLRQGLQHLRQIGAIKKISHLYETEPVGRVDQDLFYNLVVELETALAPLALLRECQQAEVLCGRWLDDVSNLQRWGPRTLDIDLLMMFRSPGQRAETIRTSELVLPHPRMEQREFVLAPLREIAPDLLLPSGCLVGEAVGEGWVQRCKNVNM